MNIQEQQQEKVLRIIAATSPGGDISYLQQVSEYDLLDAMNVFDQFGANVNADNIRSFISNKKNTKDEPIL